MELVITEKQEKQTICLNMIVKNESRIISDTLRKLCDKIKFDYWVICDTGSTDNTIEVIRDFFKKEKIDGEIFCHEWKDFGHNRTLALAAAYEKTDYVLIFDADDEIVGDFKLPENLTHDDYQFQFGNCVDNNCYVRSLLVNNRKKWVYVGVLHEVIVPYQHQPTNYIINGNYYTVSGRSGDRNTNNPDKYLKDAKVLEKAYNEAVEKKDDLFNRYAFYCANSYKDHGDHENAVTWYLKTLTHNNWSQEKYICCLRLHDCYKALNKPEMAYYYCVKSFNYDSERGEGLYHLIQHYCCEGNNEIAYAYYSLIKNYLENNYLTSPPPSKLFVDNNILNFFLPYFMIIVSEKTRNYKTGIKMFSIIFNKKPRGIPNFYIGCLIHNLQFFIDKLIFEEKTDFLKSLQDYVNFLEEIHYPLHEADVMVKYEKYGIKTKNTIENQHFSIDQCKKSNKVLFYTGWAGEKWNFTFSLQNALGGSETAVAYLSKNFPTNYEIYVAGDVEEEVVDNIHYIHNFNLPNFLKTNAIHSIVISRYIGFLELFSFFSTYQLFLWAHDTVFHAFGSNSLNDQQILNKWNFKITNVVCLTEWHKQHISERYPMIKDKIVTINNGLRNELFTCPLNEKIAKSFVYSSCSERGLGKLLALWPKIIEKWPEATLKISSYNNFPKDDNEVTISEIIKQYPSIEHLGRLCRSDLYKLTATSEYWLYPSYWPETSCITALEMLRSEVICVYYPVAGLINTMQDFGIPIKENEELEVLFSITEEQKDILRFTGRKYAESCSWENRATVWCDMIFTNDINNNIKIINLERRPDRKEEMVKKLKEQDITNYEFVKAVDGKELTPTNEIKEMFEGNCFFYRKAVIGCALSHINLWKQLVEDELNDYYIIIEDDVTLASNFSEKLNIAIKKFKEGADFLYLGAFSTKDQNVYANKLEMVKKEGEKCECTWGYIISKNACKKMLNYFKYNPIRQAVDYAAYYKNNIEKLYYLNESIIMAPAFHHEDSVDSDIQNDMDFLSFP
jgi:GR25 family glycosyltransferase involved in LPS biosynthesis/tetratricopeptide (TPR) repeat protein